MQNKIGVIVADFTEAGMRRALPTENATPRLLFRFLGCVGIVALAKIASGDRRSYDDYRARRCSCFPRS